MDCRAVSPDDWVAAVLASSAGPAAGETLEVRPLWGDRVLERRRDGALRQSVRRDEAAGPAVRKSVWYCGEDPVLEMQVRGSVEAGGRRLPSSFELNYVKAGLTFMLELREVHFISSSAF